MSEKQQSMKQEFKKDASKAPFLKLNAGVIKLAAWENEGKEYNGVPSKFVTLKLQRSYKDGEVWKNTDSFRVNDIPVLQMLLQKAFEQVKMSKSDEAED
jgi:hypothetical protein